MMHSVTSNAKIIFSKFTSDCIQTVNFISQLGTHSLLVRRSEYGESEFQPSFNLLFYIIE